MKDLELWAINENTGNERWKDGILPSILWGHMLDMIYTGNAATAIEIFEKAGPPETEGKSEFLSHLYQQLATSPYYEEIRNLNGCERLPGS